MYYPLSQNHHILFCPTFLYYYMCSITIFSFGLSFCIIIWALLSVCPADGVTSAAHQGRSKCRLLPGTPSAGMWRLGGLFTIGSHEKVKDWACYAGTCLLLRATKITQPYKTMPSNF